ncbi:hypothetical protein [Paracidovorax valerianellae]|uniref:Uncharacterized protein n=1 Tax=Paracidovorax valerianellae TaxID=187868 RepID=A0A1G6YE53_9BURK|nr:hypothetical protein [Paracidovorax valerianellae]MDA8445780.1 hypothetical protein [Paracidovorax valerianellae]SDD88669.1 hypothetical protein SAMN05192589_11039 [Paracidovorax valerianellae]
MRAPSSRFLFSFRTLLRGALIGTALFQAWHAMAQAPSSASDPQVAAAPLAHRSVPASPSPLDAKSIPWREANDAVAATPRGHADIVAWEAHTGQAKPPAAPGHGAHHHAPAPLPARGAP